ncbi:MAG: type II secretion system protein [Verrucomicrobia bacterium]|nr:type II secretion system protein [Verrucomicrobiota bacterium]MCH8511631.1 type II secretion system GspH family protein [Kiritimatiellia bacterium]
MKRGGFTLIEMLVVIAVILLLGAMTVPMVGRALERGKTTQCLANLRAMSQGVGVFLVENQGQFPPALVSGGGNQKGWDFFISETGKVEPGWIWQEYGANNILQCPSFRGADNWQEVPYTGYNYNASYLGGMFIELRGQVIRDVPSANIAHVQHPGRTAMFGDGEYVGGTNKFMRAPLPGPLDADFSGREGGTQGYRHGGHTHVAFVDGRVDRLRPVSPPSGFQGSIGEGTGFLSSDNSLYGAAPNPE